MDFSGSSSSSSSSSSSLTAASSFTKDQHILFLQMMLRTLPPEYQEQDPNRLTLAYFAISALDILNALDPVSYQPTISLLYFSPSLSLSIDKDGVIDWVLSLQQHPANTSELDNGIRAVRKDGQNHEDQLPLNQDDSLTTSIYLAQSYDGGFGLVPGSESHAESNPKEIKKGACETGPTDYPVACGCCRVGGVLKILGAHHFLDKDALRLLDEPGLKPLCVELGITDFSTVGM
ncbi:hypothetical protein ACLOJK_029919 [Asimina triloba]